MTKINKKIFPLYYLTWNTTCRCNLRCKHCYNDYFERENIQNELSTKEVINLINQAIPLGLKCILFTGGEPLLRNDLLELMKFAKKKKLLVFLATNGTLVNNNFIKNFQGLIDRINISLDAASAKKHDAIRGVRGSFSKSLKAIDNLKKYFNTSIAFTAHSDNLNELSRVAKIAKNAGISLTVKRFIPVGEGRHNALTLSQSDYKILIDEVNQLKAIQKVSFKDPFPASFGRKTNVYGGCLAGIYSLSVDFNGNVYICTKLKVLFGNIKTVSLLKIWHDSKTLDQLRSRKLKGKCKTCDRILSCGGCRAAAFADTGDFLDADPLCFYRKLKVK